MTIGAIAADRRLQGVERREIGATLLKLQREGELYRSLRDGKAYYSANSKDGVSRNPMQEYIGSIGSSIAGRLGVQLVGGTGESDILLSFENAINSAVKEHFQGEEQEQVTLPASRTLNVTYRQGTTIDCGDYTVAVPDGFRVRCKSEISENVMSPEGVERDFVIWLPDADDLDSEENGELIFYAGAHKPWEFEHDHMWLPEIYANMLEYSLWESGVATMNFLGPQSLHQVRNANLNGCYIYQTNIRNFQIQTVMPDRAQYFRVQASMMLDVSEDQLHVIVQDWLSRITLKKPFVPRKSLADKSFFEPFDTAAIERWNDHAELCYSQYQLAWDLGVKAEITRMQKQDNNGYKRNAVRRALAPHTEALINEYFKMLDETIEAIETQSRNCKDDKLLMKFYEAALEFAGRETITVGLHGDVEEDLVTPVPAEPYRERLKTDRIRELLAKEQSEKKRLEEEKRLKEEAEKAEKERIKALTRPKDRDGKERASMADAAFFLDGLTEQEIRDWKSYFEWWTENFDKEIQRCLQEEAQKYFDRIDFYNFDQLHDQLNPCVKTRVRQYEQMVSEVASAVEEQSAQCQSDAALFELYWAATELAATETFVINVDDGKNEPGRVLKACANVNEARRRFQTDRVKKLLQDEREQAIQKLDLQLAEATEQAQKNVAERVLLANRTECKQKVIKYLDHSIDRLQSQLTDVQQQRAKTFALMFARRKELQQNIDELTKQINQRKAYRGKINGESDYAPSAGMRALYVLACHRQPMEIDDVIKCITDIPGDTMRSAVREAQEGGAVSLTDRLSIDESCYIIEQTVEVVDEEKEQYQLVSQKLGIKLNATGSITDWRETMISKLSAPRKEASKEHIGSITVNPVTKRDKRMASLKDDILCVLSLSSIPLTVSEIMGNDGTFDGVSNQQVAATLRRLVAEGEVQKVEDGRRTKFYI